MLNEVTLTCILLCRPRRSTEFHLACSRRPICPGFRLPMWVSSEGGSGLARSHTGMHLCLLHRQASRRDCAHPATSIEVCSLGGGSAWAADLRLQSAQLCPVRSKPQTSNLKPRRARVALARSAHASHASLAGLPPCGCGAQRLKTSRPHALHDRGNSAPARRAGRSRPARPFGERFPASPGKRFPNAGALPHPSRCEAGTQA